MLQGMAPSRPPGPEYQADDPTVRHHHCGGALCDVISVGITVVGGALPPSAEDVLLLAELLDDLELGLATQVVPLARDGPDGRVPQYWPLPSPGISLKCQLKLYLRVNLKERPLGGLSTARSDSN